MVIDRTIYEFSQETKLQLLKESGFRCQVCNRSKKELKEAGESSVLEIHHVMPIGIAVKHFPYLLPEIINSFENGMCMCKNCHKMWHKTEQNYSDIAYELMKLQRKRAPV